MIERLPALLRRKFVRDTITLQIGKVGVTLLGFISSFLVPVLVGVEVYGTWQLVNTLLGIWVLLNLTGLVPSAQTRLATAVGAKDTGSILNTMGFFVRVMLLYSVVSTTLLAFVGPWLAVRLYDGARHIGTLAALLSLIYPLELLYNLVVITLSSRRLMRPIAILQNINQLTLTVCAVVAVLISPTVLSLVIARLVYGTITLVISLWIYNRARTATVLTYPSVGSVLAATRYADGRGYWSFGFKNALDKNVANLYSQLPVQLVGIISGEAAAGFLGLAMNVIRQSSFFTSAIFDNMQAVVPQAVGEGAYARLWHNFRQVLVVLAAGGVVFFGAVAIAAPFVMPILGEAWLPAIPLVQALAVYGAITTFGGVFGPLYRAFDVVGAAFAVKLLTLIIVLPVGLWLIARMGALGGVWLINGLYGLSVLGTAALTIPLLRARAHQNAP